MKFNIPFNKHDAENLKGYWKLNGDGTDSSGNNNNLTGTDDSFNPGMFNRCTSFNGLQSLVGTMVMPTQSFSVSFWIKTTANNGGVFMESDGGNKVECEMFIEGGRIKSKVGAEIITGKVINDGNWHFVIMTLGSTSKHVLYVDGVKSTFGAAQQLNQPEQTQFTIGKTLFGGASYFVGDICEFSLIDKEITLSDAVAQYNAGSGIEYESLDSTIMDNMLIYYKLDGAYVDMFAGLSLEQVGEWGYKKGVFELASAFNGVDKSVDSIDFDVADGEDFTVSGWVKWEGFAGSESPGIIAKGNNQSVNYAVRTYRNTREIYFSTLNNMATEEFRSGLYIKDNEWSFVAVIVKNNTIKFYVDGVVTGQNLATPLITNTFPLHIGCSGGLFHAKFNGLIDEVAFWKEARPLEFIDELYTRRRELSITETYTFNSDMVELKNGQAALLDPMPKDIVCYYKLDKDAKDMSGNGNDAEVGAGVVFNGSARFTGTGDSFIRKVGFDNFPDKRLTVAYWVKSSDLTTEGTTFHYSEDGNNAWAVENHRNMRLELKKKIFSTKQSVADGNWHFVCTTWDNNGRFKLWLDGVVVYSRDDVMKDKVINSGGALVLGQDQDTLGGGFDATQALIGEMKGVMVFSSELSELRITDLYNNGQGKVFADTGSSEIYNNFTTSDVGSFASFSAISQGDVVYQLSKDKINWDYWDGTSWSDALVNSLNTGISGYWKLDELQWSHENDVRDSSHCGHHGTADGARPVSNGVINRCGDMRGTINLGNAMEHSICSLSIWIKGGGDIVQRNNKDGLGFNIKWMGGTIVYQTGNTADQRSTPLDGGWHHVVVTTAGQLYVDGILQTDTVNTTTPFDITNNDAILGGGGFIDEVVYYEREITEPEVVLLYNNGNGREIVKCHANSAATINNNIPTYTPGDIYVKAILSPSEGKTLVDEVQVGYLSATKPTVNAGTHKEVYINETAKPFSDATLSNVLDAYYKVNNGSYRTIIKNGYSTLEEAVQNISFTSNDAGMYMLTLKVSTGAGYVEDNMVVKVKPYVATFSVVDAITGEDLTAIEFNAGDGSKTQFMASPFTWDYKSDIFSAVIKRAGNVSRVIEVNMTNGDTTFSVELGKSIGQADLNYIAKAVWDVQLAEHKSIGSVGEKIEKNLTDTRFIALKSI